MTAAAQLAAADFVLRTEDVHRSFGGLAAVKGVSLAIKRSSVTGIIGPNGAGKTTLLNIIAGADRADAGHVYLEELEITPLPPHRIARLGVIRTFQRAGVFPTLSTMENVLLGVVERRDETVTVALQGPRAWRRAESGVMRAWELLEQFGLASLANDRAGTLSGGQKRLLELARAVLMEPKVMLLDEPMAGVSPSLVPALLEYLRTMSAGGMTVVMIEHDLAVVEDVCDSVVFMARGEVMATGTVSEVLRSPSVQAVAHGF
ncbi:MAG: ABC transporter ATP-binding protein [Chloroflexota bacterium]